MLAEVLHHEYIQYLDEFLLVAGADITLFVRVFQYLSLEEKSSKFIDCTVVDFTSAMQSTVAILSHICPIAMIIRRIVLI